MLFSFTFLTQIIFIYTHLNEGSFDLQYQSRCNELTISGSKRELICKHSIADFYSCKSEIMIV